MLLRELCESCWMILKAFADRVPSSRDDSPCRELDLVFDVSLSASGNLLRSLQAPKLDGHRRSYRHVLFAPSTQAYVALMEHTEPPRWNPSDRRQRSLCSFFAERCDFVFLNIFFVPAVPRRSAPPAKC